jgi:signal transduction histidine kinase/DNA-binding response OmpR family regulator
MQVLIADDDEVTRLRLQRLLEDWNYSVTAVGDGEAAWEVLRRPGGPRIAILDWEMPGRSGPEVCERVRGLAAPVYLMLLTRYGEAGHVVTGLRSGANDYLTKPIRRDELEARLLVASRTAELEGRLAERVAELEQTLGERRRLTAILEATPDFVAIADPAGRVVYANPAAAKLRNLPPDGPPLVRLDDAFTRRGVELLRREMLPDAARDGVWSGEAALLTANGGEVPVSQVVIAHRDPAGRVEWFSTVARDIRDRKRAEEELRASEERFRAAADASLSAFYVLRCERDADGAVVDFVYLDLNRRGAEMIDRPRADVIGRRVGEMFPMTLANGTMAKFIRVVETREPIEEEMRVDSPGLKAEWVRRQVVPLSDGVAVTATDVTAVRRAAADHARLERKVREAQQLESLGVLAGGIAHDFNNLLTGVLGNANLMRLQIGADSPLHAFLEPIEAAAVHASGLCNQMLAYAGKGQFVVEPLDLSAVVRQTRELLHTSVSKKAELRVRLADGLPSVRADTTQVRQILLNLVTNASEAIGESAGVIDVTTGARLVGRAEMDAAHPSADRPEGEYVYLEVTDTGCGMDPATRAKVFDPFFTTKFAGRGLGLSAVLGIVRSHHGAIQVESEPGRGTTFRVLLPAAGPPGEQAPVPAPAGPWRAEGLALVVDDEAAVRNVAARMLETFGFRAVRAADGREGLERFEERPGAFALAVVDLAMPLVGGEELAAELRRRRPDLPVLMMSGYSQIELAERFGGRGFCFVQKPFGRDGLFAAVRKAMGIDSGG